MDWGARSGSSGARDGDTPIKWGTVAQVRNARAESRMELWDRGLACPKVSRFSWSARPSYSSAGWWKYSHSTSSRGNTCSWIRCANAFEEERLL